MDSPQALLALAAFVVVALAANQLGGLLRRLHLPLITGFLLAGIAAGPYLLDLISAQAVSRLRWVDEVALAFIGFAAGGELYFRELRNRLRGIALVTLGLVISTFTLVTISVLLIADQIPFLGELPFATRVAVALMAGAVLVARSPSSAIAIVSELRARGPFTQLTLGVTVIMDVVVIALFALNSSVADVLVTHGGFDVAVVGLVAGEIALSVVLGFVLGQLIARIQALPIADVGHTVLLLLCGYGIFGLSAWVRARTAAEWSHEILLEPLLICMVAGFTVANFSPRRIDFQRLLLRAGPPVYVAFFTLAGASLALDTVLELWPFVFVLFLVRLLALFVGSTVGGRLAGEPSRINRVSWMAYVTQAGVGLGLAKEVAVEFPGWGDVLSTLVIAVIVVNQIVGPPLFKRALRFLGEADISSETSRRRTALVFGLDFQSAALARQLRSRGWRVRIATRKDFETDDLQPGDDEILRFATPDLATLRELGAGDAETLILMMSDEDNYAVCKTAYEELGTQQIIVRSHAHGEWERFHELGAVVVDPSTAVVNLLDQFVRSPAGASILLGMDGSQEVVDLEIGNPDFDGMPLRDLQLPLDTLVLSVTRDGHKIICHGYTRLELGDRVSAVGTRHGLEALALKFDSG